MSKEAVGIIVGALGWAIGSCIGSFAVDPITKGRKLEICNKTCYPFQAIECDDHFTECSNNQIKKIIGRN